MSVYSPVKRTLPLLRSRAQLPATSGSRWLSTKSKRGPLLGQTRGAATMNTAIEFNQDTVPPQASFHRQPVKQQEHWQQLWVTDSAYKPEYYEAIAKIMRWRRRYIEDRGIFVNHDEMNEIVHGLGASEEDFDRLQLVSDGLETDPTLPFRKSRGGRFCMDYNTRSLRRLEYQPFALSAGDDFKRHDSDTQRSFDEIRNDLQLNSVLQALMVFKAIMIHGVPTMHRQNLDYSLNKWVCTLFNLRTVTRPDILGEPALEGVHTDGVDHTMTTYLGSSNMAPNSAVTLLHDRSETTGIPFSDVSPYKIHAKAQHRKFLDTLLVADHEYKHSLSPVYAIDEQEQATRDMLIFFTRKPVTAGHISASIDSLKSNQEVPMEIPLFTPVG